MKTWKRRAVVGAATLASIVGGVGIGPAASAAPSSSNGFVWIQNHDQGAFPTVCVTQYGSGGTRIRKDCNTVTGNRYDGKMTDGWGIHFDGSAQSAYMTVNNGFQKHFHFWATVGVGNCYRETSGGTVHKATDKPCTFNGHG